MDKPNPTLGGGITYIQTTQGWLYLATMIDLFNRQVVDRPMSARIAQALANEALLVALLTPDHPFGYEQGLNTPPIPLES